MDSALRCGARRIDVWLRPLRAAVRRRRGGENQRFHEADRAHEGGASLRASVTHMIAALFSMHACADRLELSDGYFGGGMRCGSYDRTRTALSSDRIKRRHVVSD